MGDTESDPSASRAINIPFIFAAYGFGSVPDYEARMEQFADLRQLL